MKPFLLLFAVLLALPMPALGTDSTQHIYTRALQLSGQGSQDEALKLLWGLVEAHPTDPLAGEALFAIGNINEKALSKYNEAQQAYSLLLERFPNSRSALRAKTRLARLTQSRAGGDEPLREFNEILKQYPTIGGDQALARMRELYAEWPDYSQRDHVLFWIAEEESRQKQYRLALEDYRRLIADHPESKWVYFAQAKIGRAYIELRDFDQAVSAFEKLALFEDKHPGAKSTAEDQIRLAHRFRLLQQLSFLALGLAALSFLIWIGGTRWRALGLGNFKGAVVDAGILAVLYAIVAMLVSGKPGMQNTLIYTSFAVCAAAFLNSLFVSSRSFSAGGKVLLTFGAFLAATAIIYTVYYRLDTINLLYDSVQYTLEERG